MVDPYWGVRLEGPKFEIEGPRAEVGFPSPATSIQYPHQAWTNSNDKMTAKDYIFLQNNTHREKYSNTNCAEWWTPAKRCRISIVRYRICY